MTLQARSSKPTVLTKNLALVKAQLSMLLFVSCESKAVTKLAATSADKPRNSSKNAVASSIGVPLAPFSPSAKTEAREQWGESREGTGKIQIRTGSMAVRPLPGLLSTYY
jgi:hypothetical protein